MHGHKSNHTQIKAAHMKEACLMAGEWGPTGLPSGRLVPTGRLWPLCFVIMSPGEIIKLQGWFVFLYVLILCVIEHAMIRYVSVNLSSVLFNLFRGSSLGYLSRLCTDQPCGNFNCFQRFLR